MSNAFNAENGLSINGTLTIDSNGNWVGPPIDINYGGTGATNATQALINLGALSLNSPALTGIPTAPTPAAGDNSTQIATTAFVNNAVASIPQGVIFKGTVDASAANPTAAGVIGTPQSGWMYYVSVGGSTAFGRALQTSQFIIYDGTTWNPSTSTTFSVTSGIGISTSLTSSSSYVVSIDPAWPGQTAITTLGTISTGTWNANVIDIAHGGTNATTAPQALINLGGAPLNSPAFTGLPLAPTITSTDSSQSIATTAFVQHLTDSLGLRGSLTFKGNIDASIASGSSNLEKTKGSIYKIIVSGRVDTGIGQYDVQAGDYLLFNGNSWQVIQNYTPQFIPGPGVSLYTDAFGNATIGLPVVLSPTAPAIVNGPYIRVTVDQYGRVIGGDNPTTLTELGITDGAPLDSPAFTGVPMVPTAAQGTISTQIASTAFVLNQASNLLPKMDMPAAVIGTSTLYSRADHVHPTDISRAPVLSPAFTGIPTAPTPSSTDTSYNIATTEFVQNVISNKLVRGAMTFIGYADASADSVNHAIGTDVPPVAGQMYKINKVGTAFGPKLNEGDYVFFDGTNWQPLFCSPPTFVTSDTILATKDTVTGSFSLDLKSISFTSGGSLVKVLVDAKGRVVSQAPVTPADIIATLGFTPAPALGFTPVNKAGDTMTGPLIVPAERYVVYTPTIASGVLKLDWTKSNWQKAVLPTSAAAVSIQFTGTISATGSSLPVGSFIFLDLANGGSNTITWPTNLQWVKGDGTFGTLPPRNLAAKDWILFWASTGGTTVTALLM